VKIAPEYPSQPVVHVVDASRAVDVVARLLDKPQREAFDAAHLADQDHVRAQHAALTRRPLLPYSDATANRLRLEWSPEALAVPPFTGSRVIDVELAEVQAFIDWTFFFAAWELKGRFPAILEHPRFGRAARELYDHARVLLDRIVSGRLLRARAVYGFWPANTDGEDLIVHDHRPPDEIARFPMLRQQEQMPAGTPNLSLADFVAPVDSGLTDSIGAFALTSGIGADALAAAYEREHNDYEAIMVKALADRLAEATAEWLHARVRADWGFGGDEPMSQADLLAERYRGIRPAFGYPACPDHSEKQTLFDLLGAHRAGLSLTENFAMMPAASVSGLYLAHTATRYFAVGRVGRDQVEDYARRRGAPLAVVEGWLRPNLGYEP